MKEYTYFQKCRLLQINGGQFIEDFQFDAGRTVRHGLCVKVKVVHLELNGGRTTIFSSAIRLDSLVKLIKTIFCNKIEKYE